MQNSTTHNASNRTLPGAALLAQRVFAGKLADAEIEAALGLLLADVVFDGEHDGVFAGGNILVEIHFEAAGNPAARIERFPRLILRDEGIEHVAVGIHDLELRIDVEAIVLRQVESRDVEGSKQRVALAIG